MKNIFQSFFIFVFILLTSCITEFVPKTTEDSEMLVVEGLITDKQEAYTIKLSRPQHLGALNVLKPVGGCVIEVSDDSGQSFSFNETIPGTYVSDPLNFKGILGRIYTLHISIDANNNTLKYESFPMELKPVPPIDSIYYEKVTLVAQSANTALQEGCKIFLDTHDPDNRCKYYRWEFTETWEIHVPFTVPNNVCWVTNKSNAINIKNTSVLAEDRVTRYPVNFVTNSTDRLATKYSMLVNQYSLSEDEYLYWEKSLNISEQVGGLYDMIPSSVPSNIYRLDNPNEKVLGYFSVSGTSSKRVFVKDRFAGIYNPYTDDICISDTIFGAANGPIRGLGTSVWVIINHPLPPPSYRVITRVKDCYDCTLRGANIEPDFWKEDVK
jgi:hypothetical protein